MRCRIADDQGFDLVEIAPDADPPVCKIMDYGKFKYEQDIKAKQARKNQTKVEIKEIKFRPKIDKHDYETKKRHVMRFLDAGAKVKVTIMFRGREMAHPELGLKILERVAEELGDDGGHRDPAKARRPQHAHAARPVEEGRAQGQSGRGRDRD